MTLLALPAAAILSVLGPTPSQPAGTPPKQPPAAAPQPWIYPEKLAMMQRDVVANVEGRLDHMAIDLASQTLYIAAIRQGSLEVLHVPDSRTTQSIPLSEPAGVVFTPDQRRLIVGCSGDHTVRVFKASDVGTLTEERAVTFPGEVDNIRFDAAAKRVWVGHSDSLGSFDLADGTKQPDIKLPGHHEAFVLDPAGPRIFVNLPRESAVTVIDREKRQVMATWPIKPAGAAGDAKYTVGAYPMAYDPATNRIFVVTRAPAELVVLRADTGEVVATVGGVARDADDCWFDAQTKRVLISGGDGNGAVSGVRQKDADAYELEFTVKTAPGCRTSLFVPDQHKLYVAAPKIGEDGGFVYIYAIAP